jgi:hypothetical protein
MTDVADAPEGFLDDKPVRLSKVPADRLADFEVEFEGERVRPFRFVTAAGDDGDDALVITG